MRPGAMLVMLDRGSYWQCAFVIPKGSLACLQEQGLARFRERIAGVAPFLVPRLRALASWDDVKLLSVRSPTCPFGIAPACCASATRHTRCRPWAASASTWPSRTPWPPPNILAAPLRARRLSEADLQRVQKRRHWPARVTQRVQVAIQDAVLSPVLARTDAPAHPPAVVELLRRFPLLRRLPARMVGLGVRPERVRVGPQ